VHPLRTLRLKLMFQRMPVISLFLNGTQVSNNSIYKEIKKSLQKTKN